MVRKLDHVNKSHTPGEIMKMTAASAAAAASSFMAGLDPAIAGPPGRRQGRNLKGLKRN